MVSSSAVSPPTWWTATIAEKVESAEVFEELKRLGVQFAQGYFVAKPAPIDTLTVASARGFGGTAGAADET
jgi:c-di-GMP-related signal transduction protein